jgi:hypothetical protein
MHRDKGQRLEHKEVEGASKGVDLRASRHRRDKERVPVAS